MRAGRGTRLSRLIRSPFAIARRVSAGSMTSSSCAWPAAMYGSMFARISSASSSRFAACSSSGSGLDRLAVDDVHRAVGPHDRDLRGGPGDDVVRFVREPVHHEVPRAIALAQDHADLRDGRFAHGEQHLRPVPDDPLLLDRGADDEAGHVVQEDEGDPERVAEPDEARRLVGRVHVERAAEHHRLVGDDADRLPTDPGQPGDEVLRPLGLHPEDVAVVDHRGDHLADVVGAPRRGRDDVVDLLDPPIHGIRASPAPAAARRCAAGRTRGIAGRSGGTPRRRRPRGRRRRSPWCGRPNRPSPPR